MRLLKGFTLIEILIVVGIVAILASVVLIGLRPSQTLGRDTRRIADLRQIQQALQFYFQRCGFYPGSSQGQSGCSNGFQRVGFGGMSSALTGSGIAQTVPNDPLPGRSYAYATDNNGSVYVLGAILEDPNSATLKSDIDGSIPVPGVSMNCDDAPPSPRYCISL